jgi:hypothetical protein
MNWIQRISGVISAALLLTGCSMSLSSADELAEVCTEMSGKNFKDFVSTNLLDTTPVRDFIDDLGPEIAVIRANDPEVFADLDAAIQEIKQLTYDVDFEVAAFRTAFAEGEGEKAGDIFLKQNDIQNEIDQLHQEVIILCVPFLQK